MFVLSIPIPDIIENLQADPTFSPNNSRSYFERYTLAA